MSWFARARLLLPLSDRLGRTTRIEDGYALWEGDELLEVGTYSEDVGRRLLAERPVLSVLGGVAAARTLADLVQHDGVLLPGFVKAHGHDHESPIIGMVKDVPLTAWLDGAVNVFTKFLDEEEVGLTEHLGESPHLVTYLKAKVDDLYYGITTALTHHCNYSKYHVDELAEANARAGTRMIVAVGGQDRHYFEGLLDIPHTQAVDRLDRAAARHAGDARLQVIPGPDQLFSNGPEMLRALKAWSRERGTLFHTHSSEEHGTTEWFKREYGTTEVRYALDLGILDDKTLLAHQVQTTPDDLKILRDTGTRIVHNPLANTILGSGMPPIMDMLELGIPVAISTDGSGSADSQNILAAARLASQYQKALHKRAENLPAQQVLEMITVDAANILGVNAGSLEPGKAADLVLIDLRRPNMIPTKVTNVVENLIWASDGSEARWVVAGGRVVKDDHRLTSLDAERIGRQVQWLSERLDDYKARTGALKGTGANR
ncbi:MAG: amidohydrolase family protein [Planctomycetota bacterium]|nr:amidohydrolase family protein [Planctomycetota bacterium]